MREIKYPTMNQQFLRFFFDRIKFIPFMILFKNRSYSQYGEDIVINRLLNGEKGSYVDIGSGLPCWGNNTYALYRKGWKGVLVDPISRNIQLTKMFRRRDHAVCAAVGENESTLDFYLFQPYELSTLNYEVFQKLQNEGFGRFVSKKEVSVLPLSKILEGVLLSHPLVFSIDTEGYELQVLKSNDWKRFRPDIVCIEEWENPLNNETEVRKLLVAEGYILYAYNGLSSFYVSFEYFQNMKKIFN